MTGAKAADAGQAGNAGQAVNARLKTRLYVATLLGICLLDIEAGRQAPFPFPRQATLHAQQRPAPQSHGRLFPPIDLGLLESPDRAAWQKPEQIMDVLHVADGSKVADIGAGAGWFTIRLARRVGPNGRVYSQDVQREMLEAIKRRVIREGLQNVQTRLGEGSDPNLQVSGLDAVVVVDAYQEVEERVTFLKNLARALKPNGLIGVVNWKPGRGGPGPPESVRVDKGSVVADVRAAELRIVDEETLPYQYMLVLAK
jgi:protein-L-isoaspartate O-methyltransferase